MKKKTNNFAELTAEMIMDRMADTTIYLEYHTYYGPRESWSVEVEEAFWLKTKRFKKIPDTKLARRLYKNMMGENPPEGYLYVKKV